MTTKQHRVYIAGQMAAASDRGHGMSLDTMKRVPQSTDNPWWVKGYRQTLFRFAIQK